LNIIDKLSAFEIFTPIIDKIKIYNIKKEFSLIPKDVQFEYYILLYENYSDIILFSINVGTCDKPQRHIKKEIIEPLLDRIHKKFPDEKKAPLFFWFYSYDEPNKRQIYPVNPYQYEHMFRKRKIPQKIFNKMKSLLEKEEDILYLEHYCAI